MTDAKVSTSEKPATELKDAKPSISFKKTDATDEKASTVVISWNEEKETTDAKASTEAKAE